MAQQTTNPIRCNPVNIAEWCQIARERGTDVEILCNNKRYNMSFYIAGYVIEAYLKAYHMTKGWRPPISGRVGHNLSELWKKSELQFGSSDEDVGVEEFILQKWSTDLRYCSADVLPANISIDNIVVGTKKLARTIASAVKRSKRSGK
ncbi:MAG: HEPN domain-containing protein [Magnetococcales bacterium]|nr:HEPN domain-containing protein [Magnetococcales bacterium]